LVEHADVYNEERGWNTVAWKLEAWRESNEDAGQNKANDCWSNQGKNSNIQNKLINNKLFYWFHTYFESTIGTT